MNISEVGEWFGDFTIGSSIDIMNLASIADFRPIEVDKWSAEFN